MDFDNYDNISLFKNPGSANAPALFNSFFSVFLVADTLKALLDVVVYFQLLSQVV